MYSIIIKGRKRRVARLNSAGDPVIDFDTSPLVLTCSNEASALAEAKFLVPELTDSPTATVTLPGGSTISLQAWLSEAKALPSVSVATPTEPLKPTPVAIGPIHAAIKPTPVVVH